MLSPLSVRELVTRENMDPLDQLHSLNGCYLCPKDKSGKRLGPLVGYAGRDELGRQLVGDIYANFGMAEEVPSLMLSWARRMANTIEPYLDTIDAFVGAPRGGESFADKLAQVTDRLYLYPEKRVIELATTTSREKTELVFQRHQLETGMRLGVTEDVMNNFTTSGQFIDLIYQQGCTVTVLIGILNRSPHIDVEFEHAGMRFPVGALVRRPLPEYRQDDPEVIDDIQAGNVIFKPKDRWSDLMAAMQRAA